MHGNMNVQWECIYLDNQSNKSAQNEKNKTFWYKAT